MRADTHAIMVNPDATRVVSNRYPVSIQKPMKFLGCTTFNHEDITWSVGSIVGGAVSLHDGDVAESFYSWGIGIQSPQGECVSFDSVYIRINTGIWFSATDQDLIEQTMFSIFYS